jgi:predicted nucleotidyltransferase
MKDITKQAIDELIVAIVSEVEPEKVYLFGSLAQGSARQDSDVDILVVVSGQFGPNNNRYEMLSRLLSIAARLRIPADILVYTTNEVKDWLEGGNNVIEKAVRQGKSLYERD